MNFTHMALKAIIFKMISTENKLTNISSEKSQKSDSGLLSACAPGFDERLGF